MKLFLRAGFLVIVGLNVSLLHASSPDAVFRSGDLQQIFAHIDETLAQKKPPKGFSGRLAKILSDPNSALLLKERAAWALGQLDARKHVDALVKATEQKSLIVRAAALNALIHMRARSGLEAYRRIAEEDPAIALRQRAIVALGLLRWEEAIAPLVELSSGAKVELRGTAALAMGATQSKKNDFRELLKELLADESAYVAMRAQKGLDVAERRSERVRDHFKEEDPDIRLFGALYFHYQGKAGDLDFLNRALKDEKDEDVRFELNRAIQGIKKRVAREQARLAKIRKEKELKQKEKKARASEESP